MSGDARYGQQGLCRPIRAAGGDERLAVTGTHPSRLAAIVRRFSDPPPGEAFLTAQPVDKPGERLEERRRRASATLSRSLQEAGGPDGGLVLEVAAQVRWPRHPTRPARHERRSLVSRLPADTSPDNALRAVRCHWHLENRRHWPRAVTLGEDACQVRVGHAPQVLAALRNAVVGLLHWRGVPNLAAALRTHAWSPPALLGLLGLVPS